MVLGKSTWALPALTCHIELFTQAHYRQSVEPDENLSETFILSPAPLTPP